MIAEDEEQGLSCLGGTIGYRSRTLARKGECRGRYRQMGSGQMGRYAGSRQKYAKAGEGSI
jgi:hypothetical protein